MWQIAMREKTTHNTMTTALTVDDLKKTLMVQQKNALNNFFQGDEKKTLKFLSATSVENLIRIMKVLCNVEGGLLLSVEKESK